MPINTLARALSLAAMVLVMVPANAEARKSRAKPSSDAQVVALLKQVLADNKRTLAANQRENEKLRREIAEIADFARRMRPDAPVASLPGQVASLDMPVPEAPRNPVAAVPPMPIPLNKSLKSYEKHIARSAKLKDLTPRLASKVSEILAACPGARLVSGYRRGARVRGSGRPSLHSHYPSKAADLQGNPSCMRKKLAGWPGGLSTDYAAVNHYHVSYAPKGREWGARFAHYGSRRHVRKTRYAAVR